MFRVRSTMNIDGKDCESVMGMKERIQQDHKRKQRIGSNLTLERVCMVAYIRGHASRHTRCVISKLEKYGLALIRIITYVPPKSYKFFIPVEKKIVEKKG